MSVDLRLINRIGYASLAITGSAVRFYEKFGHPDLKESLPIVLHLGDISFGATAVFAGQLLATVLRGREIIKPKYEKAISLAATGVLFGLILLNETIGLGGGTPDLKDIPGAVIGVLGAASLLESQNKC